MMMKNKIFIFSILFLVLVLVSILLFTVRCTESGSEI